MTQIRSMAQPVPRRPGELGVHSLDHFNFMVPDLSQAEKFYGLFGLNLKEENNALSLYTHGHTHRWGTVSEGPRKKLHFISFGAFEDDMPKFRQRLEELRIDRLDPPKGFESNGIWFRDPDGTLIEIRVAEKSSPNSKSGVDPFGGEAGRQNAPNRSKAPLVRACSRQPSGSNERTTAQSSPARVDCAPLAINYSILAVDGEVNC